MKFFETKINQITYDIAQVTYTCDIGGSIIVLIHYVIAVDDDNNDHSDGSKSNDAVIGALCLTLPGEVIYLTPVLNAKKFRHVGKKEDVVRVFYKLEEQGLGKTVILSGSRGTNQVW